MVSVISYQTDVCSRSASFYKTGNTSSIFVLRLIFLTNSDVTLMEYILYKHIGILHILYLKIIHYNMEIQI